MMNRTQILNLIGFTADPSYIGVIEVLSIPPENILNSDRLVLKVYNKYKQIEMHLEYRTQGGKENIWMCNILLDNDKFKQAIAKTSTKEEILDEHTFKEKVVAVFNLNINRDNSDTLSFSI